MRQEALYLESISSEKAARLHGAAEIGYFAHTLHLDLNFMPQPTKADIIEFLAREFPQSQCVVEEIGDRSAIVSHPVGHNQLRPGGTVAGPLLMGVADVAIYVAVLATIGIVPLAVTTNLSINFLRKPPADRPIIGKCRLLKVGRILAIGEVALYSDGTEEMVAHAVGTYSIPPKR
jgi:acyl-coenzyme A thioesterase PaaI-like protein